MAQVIFCTWQGQVIGSPEGHSPLTEAEGLNFPKAFEDGRPLKAFMGWAGIIIQDNSVNMVDMAREYMKKAQQESCGRCVPCRMGTRVMLERLERICEGKGDPGDLERLEELALQVSELSMCDIGQSTPLPILDTIRYFRRQYLEAIDARRPLPRGKYLATVTAPCTEACPSHLDIPGYVEKIKLGQLPEALEIIRRDCPMPGTIGRVCVRPCESHCRRGLLDEPIAIKYLKRAAADYELEHDWEPKIPKRPFKEEKVAIVGAGPAGLSCAYYLGLRGYRSTLFEALPEPGGMAAVGIPEYRLPKRVLRREIQLVEKLGAEIRCNVRVGKDITLDQIIAQGYKAVFLATGAHESMKMRCEGEDEGYEGYMAGIVFLREIAQGRIPLKGNRIVVIGGGNVALDCVRSALRIGFKDVNLVYRRTEAEMPADEEEIRDARAEGVKFHFLTQPIKILAENGKVTGLECLRMRLGEPDQSGRARPVPVEGSNFVLKADAVVAAIGQTCNLDYLKSAQGIELTKWNTLVVDRSTLRVDETPLFGGGDCVSGPLTLIAALADGKKAARFIAQYLEKGHCSPEDQDYMEGLMARLGVFGPQEKMPIVGGKKRVEMRQLDPSTRVNSFEEVELGFTVPQALEEASRCLRCYRIGLIAL